VCKNSKRILPVAQAFGTVVIITCPSWGVFGQLDETGWKMAVQFILQVFGTKEIRSVTSKNMYSVALVLRKVEFP
jgi:hypothetical protein